MQKQMTARAAAALCVGAVMGSGFVSGKEIFRFFTRFGRWGAAGLAAAAAGLCALCVAAMRTARARQSADPVDAVCPFGQDARFARALVSAILTGSLLVVYAGMLAAGGTAFAAEFGIPQGWGALGLAVFSALVSSGGLEALQKSVGRAVPLMLAGLLAAAAVCGARLRPGSAPPAAADPAACGWNALLYLSYNLVVALPVVCAAGHSGLASPADRRGGILAAAALTLCGLCVHWMLGADTDLAARAPMPILAFAARVSRGLRAVCSFLLIVSISCAAANCLFGLSAPLRRRLGERRGTAVCAAAGYLVSLLGFERIIARLYPAQGVAGLCVVAGVIACRVRFGRGFSPDGSARKPAARTETGR